MHFLMGDLADADDWQMLVFYPPNSRGSRPPMHALCRVCDGSGFRRYVRHYPGLKRPGASTPAPARAGRATLGRRNPCDTPSCDTPSGSLSVSITLLSGTT